MRNYTKELGHKTIIMLELKNICSDKKSLMDGFNGIGYTVKRRLEAFPVYTFQENCIDSFFSGPVSLLLKPLRKLLKLNLPSGGQYTVVELR